MRSRFLIALLLTLSLGAPAQDYSIAVPGYRFEFPRDYFNHEAYQTEWWYYTGNLRATDGHRFGFELTFFRQGVSRTENRDPWFVHDVWMAHLALSDMDGRRFRHEERLNRAGPTLAGVDPNTGMVWNGNWQAQITPGQEKLQGIGNDFSLQLQLVPTKPPVEQGQNGVSQKAAGVGHASHYFSLTRLVTKGSIQVDGKFFEVDGASWMDHEFFTGSMAADESGWDWLSVQLKDGSELMLYRLRYKDGRIDPYSSGSFVDALGKAHFLACGDFAMTPAEGGVWTSPTTKAAYPERWHVSVPRFGLELNVTTPLPDQELVERVGPSYWEGAIDIVGTGSGSSIEGVGYLEMTGYAGGGPIPAATDTNGSSNP